jgi:nicotinate-nucleotide pyrophosphorylase
LYEYDPSININFINSIDNLTGNEIIWNVKNNFVSNLGGNLNLSISGNIYSDIISNISNISINIYGNLITKNRKNTDIGMD